MSIRIVDVTIADQARISRMEAAHLHRSMFKKGGSPDNSACEGFFGRMKNEMFYEVSWLNVSIEEFIHIVEEYMVWYQKTNQDFSGRA